MTDRIPGILNCVRAIGGYTYADSAETVFDTDTFKEAEYLAHASESSGNPEVTITWWVHVVRRRSLC